MAEQGPIDARFDELAASWRLAAQDVHTFLEVLADKLAAALPGAVQVRRAGGLLRRDHPVTEVAVRLGDWHYRLAVGAGGRPQAERAHLVRGVALKSETMELVAWIDALVAALAAHARSSEAAAEALHSFLT